MIHQKELVQIVKTVFQCDFDGTITEKDVSYLLLDAFAGRRWRELLEEYQEGKMSVGAFNTRAFAMVKADRETLLDLVLNSGEVQIRPGFCELVGYCHQHGLEFVIVSNGQDFYIEAILNKMGMNNIEFFAARSKFGADGLEVKYIGPWGKEVLDRFKEAYTRLYLDRGYRVIYAGNGISDIYPARYSHHVFATDDLLDRCREENLDCIPFNDLNDVVRELKLLTLD
jgi:2-hydroxy-3-keto-5-methylthiopentenyl-1-phosphate phosphatase